ncbi:MAG: hypothetical protein AAF718_12325 [Pseudomonadota bacterium]
MMGLATPSVRPVNFRDDSITGWISYDRKVWGRPKSVTRSNAISLLELSWQAIEAMNCLRGVTVLRSSNLMIEVPDGALPPETATKVLQACTDEWCTA